MQEKKRERERENVRKGISYTRTSRKKKKRNSVNSVTSFHSLQPDAYATASGREITLWRIKLLRVQYARSTKDNKTGGRDVNRERSCGAPLRRGDERQFLIVKLYVLASLRPREESSRCVNAALSGPGLY